MGGREDRARAIATNLRTVMKDENGRAVVKGQLRKALRKVRQARHEIARDSFDDDRSSICSAIREFAEKPPEEEDLDGDDGTSCGEDAIDLECLATAVKLARRRETAFGPKDDSLISCSIKCQGCGNWMPLDDSPCPECGESAPDDEPLGVDLAALALPLSKDPLNKDTAELVRVATVAACDREAYSDRPFPEETAALGGMLTGSALAKGVENAPDNDQILGMEAVLEAIADITITYPEWIGLERMLSPESFDYWAEAGLAILLKADSVGDRERAIFDFVFGRASWDDLLSLRDFGPSEDVRGLVPARFEELEAEVARRQAGSPAFRPVRDASSYERPSEDCVLTALGWVRTGEKKNTD